MERIASGEWKKEGGILGKLNFESASTMASSPRDILASPPLTGREEANTSYTGSIESVVMVDLPTSIPPSSSQGATVPAPVVRSALETKGSPQIDDDLVEQLETPEKKRFWKVKAKPRRSSEAGSEKDLDMRVSTCS